MNTKRYTLSDAHSTQFYQLPKWLVALRVEAEISNEAILLYTYLRDRVQLSITNKWIDDNGEAYLYFKREQMEKLLGCKKDKVQKIIKELKSVNLLDEVRQGLNQPNRLYLRYPDNSELIEMSIDFEDEDEEITWVKQDNIINTINYMKKADVALGHKCGYVSPIPYIELKEDINEDLFKDYIEAVSNEAISWEGIREQLVKYHGFRYVPKSELEESKVREIKFDGIGKWVLGSPLCLNFTHLDKIPSFYNPEGARGEDAFFSTWLENSKVIEMPVYHFHDAFLKYTNILNEKYPKKLRKIKMEDEQTTERFIKASIGWIRYKPLFIYLTDRKNYNEKIDQIREKLRISIPEVNKLFANSDLNLLLPELEKFNSSVKKDYDDYIKTDEAWKKVKKAMTENK